MLLLVVGLGLLAGKTELEYRELTAAVDAHVATYQRQRWERPVLRGAPAQGNAAAEAQAALEGFSRLPPKPRTELAELVYYGNAPSKEQMALLDSHEALIAKLRGAAQCGWSVTMLNPATPGRPPVPDYVRFVDAMLVLLADASRRNPEACLATVTDAMRLGQDLVPGAPLEATSVSMRITSLAIPVLTRCARNASYAPLLATARELHNLATHPPPSFSGLELADTTMLVRLRELGQAWPVPEGENPLTRIKRRPALFRAFRHFDRPARWRELKATDYPESLEAWLQEQEWRDRSDLAMVNEATSHAEGWLFDDMRGQALLRIATVGIATMAERENRQRMPREPISLADQAMRDPFNGRPLQWRIAQDGSELTIWSVGEDRRDDKGSSEWTSQAPIDVTVHFRLRPTSVASRERSR